MSDSDSSRQSASAIGTTHDRPWWKKKRFNIPLGVVVLFIVLVIIGAATGGPQNRKQNLAQDFRQGFEKGEKAGSTNHTTTTAAPNVLLDGQNVVSTNHTTTTAPTTTTTAAPKVLLDVSGSGIKSTQTFTVPNEWQLVWSYSNCAGGSGNFIVTVYNSDGSPNDAAGVNELGASGSDTEYYHSGGGLYLEVNSECSWHVTAKG